MFEHHYIILLMIMCSLLSLFTGSHLCYLFSSILFLNIYLANFLLISENLLTYFVIVLLVFVVLCHFTFHGCNIALHNIPIAFGTHISQEGSGLIQVLWLYSSQPMRRVKNLRGFISCVCIGGNLDLPFGQEFYEAMHYKCLITLRGWKDGSMEWMWWKEIQSSSALKKP